MAETNRTWAMVRVGLGLAQVMGATATLVFLVQTGVSNLTVVTTATTLFFTALSRVLFLRSDRKE